MTPTPKDQTQLLDERKKQLIQAHQVWLGNPITQEFIRFLQLREQGYINDLTKNVLVSSNELREENSRACIKTCQAVTRVATDSVMFVDIITKQKAP